MNEYTYQTLSSQHPDEQITFKYKTEKGTTGTFSMPEIKLHAVVRGNRFIYHEDPKRCPNLETAF